MKVLLFCCRGFETMEFAPFVDVMGWARNDYGMSAEESIASEAELDFETVPVKIYCNRCQKEYEGKRISAIRCLDCGTNDITVLSGIEIDELIEFIKKEGENHDRN